MGDVLNALGELVGTVVGGAARLVVGGVEAMGNYAMEHSIYVKCPYCGQEVKVLKYKDTLMNGSNDTGLRKCSNCESTFYIK